MFLFPGMHCRVVPCASGGFAQCQGSSSQPLGLCVAAPVPQEARAREPSSLSRLSPLCSPGQGRRGRAGLWSCCVDRSRERDLELSVLWEGDQSRVLGAWFPGCGCRLALDGRGLGMPRPGAQRRGAQWSPLRAFLSSPG